MDRIKSGLKKIIKAGGDKSFRKSYSQSGEDMIIDYIFRTVGIEQPDYIDIGAHHPDRLSNTAFFYERGSSGINIEPDPILFESFSKLRKRDVNLNVGVGGKMDTLEFYCLSASALNTFSREEAERMCAKYGYQITRVIPVSVRTLGDIISKEAKGRFPDFLSLDVEGLDDLILSQIDYESNSPKVICVETISFEEDGTGVKNDEMIMFLKQKGYLMYADTYINSIFVQENLWFRR
jgi:FkbM family methyltransferase